MEYKMYAKMIVIFKEKIRRNIGYFVAECKNNDQAKQRRKQKRDIEKGKKAKQLSFAKPYDNLQRSSGEETYANPNDDEATSVEAKKSEAKAKAKKAFLQRRSLMNKEGSKLTTKKCLEFSPCYETMEGNNDVLITKVTISDKDCAEIAVLENCFPHRVHILCQFHALKAVDVYIKKLKDGELVDKEKIHEIIKQFRAAMCAESRLILKQQKCSGPGSIAAYFENNWFNIADKWSNLGGRNLPTFGNNTTNRLERFHNNFKDVLHITKRLSEVLRNLIDIVLIRLSHRRLKLCIREVKFSKKEKHPLLKKFADTISPFAWGHLEAELKIMKANFNFESSTYHIVSRYTRYKLKQDLTGYTCNFFLDFLLPCRHIIYFHIKENTEVPVS
ncbi:hypothetical protein DAPPUDRAFT_319032 [Daphnia pulex]|uniref:SWIM-type domain-containing protein n=1 Tax=Daphnia pulex TaxID=6669 RepID=E9GKG5_DAPPU|nr:hypothetical protein DAPPUDRAFT_319032 [Daphnia pulex]|eukprot:EFX80068.1 hypothetical protein DAPPUDRAFT_319032 [Daphnia pulex]